MKEVTINGVSYLPASALAKEFRYTTDYIGQLCRAKKVDAQLVGRSWYVNPISLTAHKKAKYSKTNLAEKTIENNTKVEISRIDVTSTLNKNTLKSTKAAPQNFAKRIEWKPAKYEDDEGDLYPVIKREIEPARVHVKLADATSVSIKMAGGKSTAMVAEPLPTVSLKGKVSISSIEEDFEELSEDATATEVPTEVVFTPQTIQNSLSKPPHRPRQPLIKSPAPQSLPAMVITNEAIEVKVGGKQSVSQVIKISYTFASVALALLLVMVLFAESYVRADALTQQSGLEFSTASFSALVTNFTD